MRPDFQHAFRFIQSLEGVCLGWNHLWSLIFLFVFMVSDLEGRDATGYDAQYSNGVELCLLVCSVAGFGECFLVKWEWMELVKNLLTDRVGISYLLNILWLILRVEIAVREHAYSHVVEWWIECREMSSRLKKYSLTEVGVFSYCEFSSNWSSTPESRRNMGLIMSRGNHLISSASFTLQGSENAPSRVRLLSI